MAFASEHVFPSSMPVWHRLDRIGSLGGMEGGRKKEGVGGKRLKLCQLYGMGLDPHLSFWLGRRNSVHFQV